MLKTFFASFNVDIEENSNKDIVVLQLLCTIISIIGVGKKD